MSAKEIKLESVLDLSNTQELQSQFKKALKSKKEEIVIDGSEVQRVKTPAIQLLLSLQMSLANEKRKLILQNPSEILQKAIRFIGVSEIFGLKGEK